MEKCNIVVLALYDANSFPICTLHAVLKEADFNVHSIFFKNMNADNTIVLPSANEIKTLIRLIKKLEPDLVGICVRSAFFKLACEITTKIKNELNTKVIWGGIHPTLRPTQCLEFADIVCIGEGEGAIVELATKLSKGEEITNIQNLWLKKDGNIIQNDVRPLIQDLDSLPFPDYSSENKYFVERGKVCFHRPDASHIMTSRGCPFGCTYCCNNALRKIYERKGRYVRRRSVDNVIAELIRSKRSQNLKLVNFLDDVFTMDVDWIKEFYGKYKEAVNLPFCCYCHPKFTNEETIQLLKNAGVSFMGMGIQAGSEDVRNRYFGRYDTNEDIVKATKILNKYGISYTCDLIMDDPLETEKDKEETFELLLKLPRPFFTNIHTLTHFPETKLTKLLLARGVILESDIEDQKQASYNRWNIQLDLKRNKENMFWASLYFLVPKGMPKPILMKLSRNNFLKRHPQLLTLLLRVGFNSKIGASLVHLGASIIKISSRLINKKLLNDVRKKAEVEEYPKNNEPKKRGWDDYSPVDVCLVNPPWITKSDNIWHGIKGAMPPLAFLSIAAHLEEKGLSAAIIDLHVEKLSPQEFKNRIAQLQPKVVGITVITATAVASNLVARLVKEVDPSILVVMGGVHAEVLPEECLNNRSVDIVVRGDGEFTFYHLCDCILKGKSYKDILGISFRDMENGRLGVIHNAAASLIEDLNQLPSPAYHLIPMHLYYPAIGAYRRLPAINMLMTRGCAGRCSFCNSAKISPRARDPEIIVKKIIKLKERYGIREIQFYDDTFTVIRKNVLKFCELMQRNKVDISWVAFARVDFMDEEMASAMKKAGCHQIMFGVESGDPDVLKKMGKPIQLEKTKRAVQILQKVGIETRCTFIYGCEGETIASMQRTLDFALELDPDLALFNIATSYPGTQLYKWAKENGYLLHEDWTQYELGHPVIKLPTVSPEEIVKFYRKSFKVFYLRPKIIWRKIKRATSISQWKDMISAFLFIMFRYKSGIPDDIRYYWSEHKKEEFFDFQFHNETSSRVRLTYEVRKPNSVLENVRY